MKKEAGFGALPKAVQRGIRRAVASETPFVLAPLSFIGKKVTSPKAVEDFFWKYLQGPMVRADVAAGSALKKVTQKLTGKPGKMWEAKMLLPLGKAGKGATGMVEHTIPSATAPLGAVSKVVVPMLGAMKLEEMLKKESSMSNKPTITKADLQKTAAMLTSLHEQNQELIKEARAIKLLYKQAELGQLAFPKTHAELTEKVAELMRKDLNVVEEAIKLASSNDDISSAFGKFGESSLSEGSSARENFERALIEN